MCKVQWVIPSTIQWTFVTILLLSFHGTLAADGCSNSSSCSYHSNSTNCTVSSFSKYRITAYKSITTGSIDDEIHAGRDGQLSNYSISWCASKSTVNQFLQIDLGSVYELWLIATQGFLATNISGYVTSYKMAYSLDSSTWYTYKDDYNSRDKEFPGNTDATHTSCNSLNSSFPFVTRFLRIHPLAWIHHVCMRIELFGVIHKCPSFRNLCSLNTSCVIFNNSIVCLCPDGFRDDGRRCSDIDECKTQVSTCHPNSTCVNTNGSFTCICKHGYYGNASNCTDIDECAEHSHSCSPYAHCINSNGSYSCRCKTGYYGNGSACVDIDECYNKSHSCHGNATCSNTAGSYSCFCNSGYRGDGKNCTDVDECSTGRACPAHSICNNIPGSYNCTCSEGFTGDGHNCTDVNVPSTTTTTTTIDYYKRYLGIAIGIPIIATVIILVIIAALVYIRYRRRVRVIRRPKQTQQQGSRPSSTVIGQIDKLFDDEKKLRDSVSLRSLQFSIPSVHQSLTALNNIGLAAKNYENLQP